MRGNTYEEAEAILTSMKGYENKFAVEMTLNTPKALENITRLKNKFGNKIKIGAGTVRSLEDVENCISVGAEFILGPHTFSEQMIELAHEHHLLAIPAAMTPSEIDKMFSYSADIVKVFPAAVVSPRFFKDVQAPLGKLPLMGVGGISAKNAKDYLDNGASYLGLGSGMFNLEDVKDLNIENLKKSFQDFMDM
jgi:2-dehydro-3-deoxyphosphogluconate aldolase/(4S)-4-hydroxy-2-oxoglutarate aldolase